MCSCPRWGPFVAIWKAAPYIWKGLTWLWDNWGKPALVEARDYLRDVVLPAIQTGVPIISGLLGAASSWLQQAAGGVRTGVQSLVEAVGASTVFRFARGAVAFVATAFSDLADWASTKLVALIGHTRAAIEAVWTFLSPVREFLRQAVLISVLGPLSILDDGVWVTVQWFLRLAMRVPCVKELGGLVNLPGLVASVGEFRNFLKKSWQIMQDPDTVIEGIKSALSDLVAKIPGAVNAVLGSVLGSTAARHLNGVIAHLLPHLRELATRWWPMLKQMAWDLLWPWPSVGKDFQKLWRTVNGALSDLGNLSLSKAADALLEVWQALNGLAGHLYGWFFLASVLVGTILGGGTPAGALAGATFAEEVGMALLLSSVLAEGAIVEKALADLASPNETPEQEQEAYEKIASSVFTLAITGTMFILGDIAVRFAKAFFREVVGAIRGPTEAPAPAGGGRPAERSAATETRGPTTETPAATEAPPAAEAPAPETPSQAESSPTSEAPATAEAPRTVEGEPARTSEPTEASTTREVPPEEVATVREKVRNPENVERVTDPELSGRYDAEIRIDDHVYRRSRTDGTWCRFSNTTCGINLGDIAAEVDAALSQKPVEAPVEGLTEVPAEAPVQTPVEAPVGSTPEGTRPAVRNARGADYPQITDFKTGEPVHFPEAVPERPVPATQRVRWGNTERGEFIKEWHDRGLPRPEGGWQQYDIHHVKPREYGGTNAFDNLTPVRRDLHKQFNRFWSGWK